MRIRNLILAVLIGIWGCKCDDEETPTTCPENPLICLGSGTTYNLDIASASPQQAYAGGLVAAPPAVRVTDTSGNGISGCSVVFTVQTGGGSVYAFDPSLDFGGLTALTTTNANGVATVSGWRLGPSPGSNRVTAAASLCAADVLATINTRSNAFVAEALPVDPQALAKVAGDGQSAAAGDTTPVRLKVRLTGQQNLPVAGQPVMFRVVGGGGTIGGQTMAIVNTDADGNAECPVWRMGTTLATEVVEASYGSLAPVRFQINSRAGRPNRVVASSTPAGSPGLASNPVPEVLVTDANNNNVQNAAVLFEVLAGGGTVGGAPQFSTLTDTAGKAKPSNWIFGATAGLNRLRATVLRNGQLDATVTGNPVTFDVTTIVSGTIVVYVTVYGSPRAGVTVTLSGAASRSGATLVDGSATFANLPVGQYTVAIVPPGGAFFNPTSQTVTLAANQTLNVSFDGFGAGVGRAGVDNLSLPGRAHAGMLTSSGN